MIGRIAFTHYCVADMDRSVDFYQNALGLKLLFKRDDWSEFEIGGQRIALRFVDGWRGSSSGGSGATVSFLAEPIEGAVDRLKKLGVRFIDELRVYPYGKLASFIDPDGNSIGLYQPPPA
ncbi:MAG: VOC family protein [Nitrospinae bacterium]|nr:VOC family protein [Nitrospinota bacterium]